MIKQHSTTQIFDCLSSNYVSSWPEELKVADSVYSDHMDVYGYNKINPNFKINKLIDNNKTRLLIKGVRGRAVKTGITAFTHAR